MKVYVKKGDCQSILPGVILTIFFLVVSLGIIIKFIIFDSFIEELHNNGVLFAFAIVFLLFGLFFLFLFLKKAKKIYWKVN